MKHKQNSSIKAPIIILVRPQMAENIGMVARAMMNCGLSELRIVLPKESPLSKKAISLSSGAQVILEQAKIYKSLDDALFDVKYSFATTARDRDMEKKIYTPKLANKKINSLLQKNEKVAIVFGPERTGLENDDLLQSNAILSIPLNPIHPSLNLAQAVLLVGWSWWESTLKTKTTVQSKGQLASQNELHTFLSTLSDILEEKGYFAKDAKKERMKHNLCNIFLRNELTSSEIKTLYRVLHTLVQIKS